MMTGETFEHAQYRPAEIENRVMTAARALINQTSAVQ